MPSIPTASPLLRFAPSLVLQWIGYYQHLSDAVNGWTSFLGSAAEATSSFGPITAGPRELLALSRCSSPTLCLVTSPHRGNTEGVAVQKGGTTGQSVSPITPDSGIPQPSPGYQVVSSLSPGVLSDHQLDRQASSGNEAEKMETMKFVRDGQEGILCRSYTYLLPSPVSRLKAMTIELLQLC